MEFPALLFPPLLFHFGCRQLRKRPRCLFVSLLSLRAGLDWVQGREVGAKNCYGGHKFFGPRLFCGKSISTSTLGTCCPENLMPELHLFYFFLLSPSASSISLPRFFFPFFFAPSVIYPNPGWLLSRRLAKLKLPVFSFGGLLTLLPF